MAGVFFGAPEAIRMGLEASKFACVVDVIRTGLLTAIFEGPVLRTSGLNPNSVIIDPIDGQLYEFTDPANDYLLVKLQHSIKGYVRRSPGYYKHLLYFGTKRDFWMFVDLPSGKILHSTGFEAAYQCPNHLHSVFTEEIGIENSTLFPIGIGLSQYTLLLRDPVTNKIELNITYETLTSQVNSDNSKDDLVHVALSPPAVVTLKDDKVLWHRRLNSPVVGIYQLWDPTDDQSSHLSPSSCQSPDLVDESDQRHAVVGNKSSRRSLILRRIPVQTYALKLPVGKYSDFNFNVISSDDTDTIFWHLVEKFEKPMNLSLGLLIGNSSSTEALYALPLIAESSIHLRSCRRLPSSHQLTGPPASKTSVVDENHSLSTSLTILSGIYELPPMDAADHRDQDDESRSYDGASRRLPRLITDQNTFSWPIQTRRAFLPTLPDPIGRLVKFLFPSSSHFYPMTTGNFPILLLSIVIGGLLLLLLLFLSRTRHRKRHSIESLAHVGNSSTDDDPLTLPSSFDSPDSRGWAGCVDQGHQGDDLSNPESVRFNLSHVLGHGANGTMVFAGNYGQFDAAVKRIVRQSRQSERHWRREHAILLEHQHPNLIRCYWTGSTANFHYLAMQRALASLADLFQPSNTDVISSDPASTPISLLDQWQLTEVDLIQQTINAVAYLHSKGIVHRDLKPSNVLLLPTTTTSPTTSSAIKKTSPKPSVRVVVGDFGLSRPLLGDRADFTNSLVGGGHHHYATTSQATDQCCYGTIGWMSPELFGGVGPITAEDQNSDDGRQHRESDASPQLTRAIDIYACGLLAHYTLTHGQHPFDEDKVDVVAIDHQCVVDATKPSINIHHSRQLAIVQGQSPNLGALTDCKVDDLGRGFLARQLVHAMLNAIPYKRPCADEILSHPLFWPCSKVIRFFVELSDIVEVRPPLSSTSGSGSRTNGTFKSSPKPGKRSIDTSVNNNKLRASGQELLLTELERHSHLVFNSHWFFRLEQEIVQDLLILRTYQDTQIVDLLRAIRNKRNHFWQLEPSIRQLYGGSQDAMADYFMRRFPALLPLTFTLVGRYSSQLTNFSDYVYCPSSPDAAAGDVHRFEITPSWWSQVHDQHFTIPTNFWPSTVCSSRPWKRSEPISRLASRKSGERVSSPPEPIRIPPPCITTVASSSSSTVPSTDSSCKDIHHTDDCSDLPSTESISPPSTPNTPTISNTVTSQPLEPIDNNIDHPQDIDASKDTDACCESTGGRQRKRKRTKKKKTIENKNQLTAIAGLELTSFASVASVTNDR